MYLTGFCQFAMHPRCGGTAAGDPCSCGCHQPAAEDPVSRDRTSPPRDLTAQVDRFGNVAVDVTVGAHRTWANLPPQTAAVFLREIADDLDRVSPSGALHV